MRKELFVDEDEWCTRKGFSSDTLSTGPCGELRITPPMPTPTPSLPPNLISAEAGIDVVWAVSPICWANMSPGRRRGGTRSALSVAPDCAAKKNEVCPLGDVGSTVEGDARLRGSVCGVGR